MTTEDMIWVIDDPIVQEVLLDTLIERCALTMDLLPGEIAAVDLDRIDNPGAHLLQTLRHIGATYN